jgi:sec-independent protein translocase protein TatA
MMSVSSTELLIILVIVLVLFGGRRIPEIFAGLGKGVRSFRKALDGDKEDPPPTAPKA